MPQVTGYKRKEVSGFISSANGEFVVEVGEFRSAVFQIGPRDMNSGSFVRVKVQASIDGIFWFPESSETIEIGNVFPSIGVPPMLGVLPAFIRVVEGIGAVPDFPVPIKAVLSTV